MIQKNLKPGLLLLAAVVMCSSCRKETKYVDPTVLAETYSLKDIQNAIHYRKLVELKKVRGKMNLSLKDLDPNDFRFKLIQDFPGLPDAFPEYIDPEAYALSMNLPRELRSASSTALSVAETFIELGMDTRMNFCDAEVTDGMKQNLDGIMLVVDNPVFDQDNNLMIEQSDFHDRFNNPPLCEGLWKFDNQKVALKARATAFLVAPDKVLTAGHTVSSGRSVYSGNDVIDGTIMETAFVFIDADEENCMKFPETIDKSNVYFPKRIVYCNQAYEGSRALDYALIELDRTVPDTDRIMAINYDINVIDVADEFYLMGFPQGLAMKVTPGVIESVDYEPIEGTALFDLTYKSMIYTLRGNSGSPLISNTSHEVFAIHSGFFRGYVPAAEVGRPDVVAQDVSCCNRQAFCLSDCCPMKFGSSLNLLRDIIENPNAFDDLFSSSDPFTKIVRHCPSGMSRP